MKTMKLFTAVMMLLTVLAFTALPVFADGETTTTAAVTTEAQAAASSSTGNKALAAGIAISLAAGLGALGMGLATGQAGEAMARQPEIRGEIRTNLILGIVFMETAIIYALIVAILIIFVM